MPKFLKDQTISLIDGAIESYLLALYGMGVPQVRKLRKVETKYAPIMGLLGASAELLAKACLVQAKGISAMYKDGDIGSGSFRFGSEVLEELRCCIRDDDPCISFIWDGSDNHEDAKKLLLHYISQFKLLQETRAAGLHAGIGCSRDITIAAATTVSECITLIGKGKKIKPYLKGIPSPEMTIRDREAIIEDLTRRLKTAKSDAVRTEQLRGIYLVLPYIPEVAPDWIDVFDRIAVAPPKENDLTYLMKSLEDAHSIFLIKNRGGKDGLSVKIDPQNPNSLPIAIQNIKRELKSTPDKFNNDVLSANTRLTEKRLDLPIDEFLVDLYAVGLIDAGIITENTPKLTAQQTWPYVASAYSTSGTPRPCWFIIRQCDEITQLISYLKRAEMYGNGYLKRRIPFLINALTSYQENKPAHLSKDDKSPFKDVEEYISSIESLTDEQKKPFTVAFLRRYNQTQEVNDIIHSFVTGNRNAGTTLSSLMDLDSLDENGRRAARCLLTLCYDEENKNGLVSVLRGSHLKGYSSMARKKMFMADLLENGPSIGA